MQAIVYHRYGSPDVLELQEIPKPTPSEDQVLIRVHAASVNPYDWHFLRGTPSFIRLFSGMGRPKFPRLGADVAGVVEAVGAKVAPFKPGDAVFGTAKGSFAEYACADASQLAVKPQEISFEQAACLPIAGITALQGLRDKGKVQTGQSVLINGAAGGVGTFAVQIAKALGGEVTAVSNSNNLDLMRSIGADHVIDYTNEDFTRSGQHYDLIFDCHPSHSPLACRRVLNSNGIYIAVGGPTGHLAGAIARMLATVFLAFVVSRFTTRKVVMFVAKVNHEDLGTLAELTASGKVTPVIEKSYRLSETAQAMRDLDEGHTRGKLVVSPGTGQ